MPIQEDTLRFGIGSPDDARSHVWRLWVRKNDVYLGARDLLQTIKVSLHKSDIWPIAFVDELEARDAENDRLVVRWKRPPEFAPGWTGSVAIIVPVMPSRRPFDSFRESDPRVSWFDAPAIGFKSVLTVLFSRPRLTEQDLSRVSMPDDRLAGSIRKTDGETVWLVLREVKLSAEEILTINGETDDLTIHVPRDGAESVAAARIFRVAWPDEPNARDQPSIADIALSKDHVTVSG
jgi:hypothetical protein